MLEVTDYMAQVVWNGAQSEKVPVCKYQILLFQVFDADLKLSGEKFPLLVKNPYVL